MTILFLSRLFWPHFGGVEKHVERVSQELTKLGHQVTVITEQYSKKLKQAEKHQGINIHRIPVWAVSETSKKWAIWYWLWQHQHLIDQADIIHVHDVFFWYLPFKFLYPFKKVFVTFHGYETKFPPSKSAIWQRRLAATLTAGNICVGDYIAKWYGIKPTLVTYGATDLGHRPIGPWPRHPSILVLGRLSQDNDIDLVIKALRKIKPASITFVGDGQFRPQAAKIGPVIGFTNNLNPYLKKANIVIVSSYLSILDALAAGRPVISVYSNPLKKDYLKPLSKYIHITSSVRELVHLIHMYTSGVYPPPSSRWENFSTWAKIAHQYLYLWQN